MISEEEMTMLALQGRYSMAYFTNRTMVSIIHDYMIFDGTIAVGLSQLKNESLGFRFYSVENKHRSDFYLYDELEDHLYHFIRNPYKQNYTNDTIKNMISHISVVAISRLIRSIYSV
jgi:5-keto 4-deoxyuronate isomerase